MRAKNTAWVWIVAFALGTLAHTETAGADTKTQPPSTETFDATALGAASVAPYVTGDEVDLAALDVSAISGGLETLETTGDRSNSTPGRDSPQSKHPDVPIGPLFVDVELRNGLSDLGPYLRFLRIGQ